MCRVYKKKGLQLENTHYNYSECVKLAKALSYSNKLTPSGTSSTKIISNYIVLSVGNMSLKGTVKTVCAQK